MVALLLFSYMNTECFLTQMSVKFAPRGYPPRPGERVGEHGQQEWLSCAEEKLNFRRNQLYVKGRKPMFNSEQVIFKEKGSWKVKWIIIYIINQHHSKGIHRWGGFRYLQDSDFLLCCLSTLQDNDFLPHFFISSLYIHLLWNAEDDTGASCEMQTNRRCDAQ